MKVIDYEAFPKKSIKECVQLLNLLLECVDDKLQGERDKMTKLVDLKPSSFEFVLLKTIELLERIEQERHGQKMFMNSLYGRFAANQTDGEKHDE